jgi:hypothetical protein
VDEATSELTIRPVARRRDLDRFIKLPFRLRRDDPHWVAPLLVERRAFLDRSKNPFFGRADVELFLCERDGEVVGRICAHIDPRYDELHGGADGFFGLFEAIDDSRVVAALVERAAGWLAERGRRRMLGPMSFTTNDEVGVLIDGFDRDPMILQPWNPPSYDELLRGAGLEKEIDLLMWRLHMTELLEGDRFHPAIHAMAEQAEADPTITIRTMRKRDLEAEIARFMEVYNEAWKSNWGFVYVDADEARFQVRTLRPILDEKWTFIAEQQGEVIGAALTLPDANQALKPLRGRLLPFGWLRFLRGRRHIDQVRVFALGVKPAHQHTGVAAAFYVRHVQAASPDGQPGGEMGWILETNEPMNRAMEGMGGTVVKRYRIYAQALTDAGADPG